MTKGDRMASKDIQFYVCVATATIATDGLGFFVGMAACAVLDSDLGDKPAPDQNADQNQNPDQDQDPQGARPDHEAGEGHQGPGPQGPQGPPDRQAPPDRQGPQNGDHDHDDHDFAGEHLG
jgi:hypothetical protein